MESLERLEDLQCGGLKIIQNKSLYCFTSDSVILANFVKTKKQDNVVEIGCGCGVISILVQAKNSLKKITAFEIQPVMAELAEKNVSINNLSEKIEIVREDIKNYQKVLKKASVDVIFCNPPYFRPTNFPQSECNKIAKEEVKLSCDDWCKISAQLLKSGGALYVCMPAERACEAIAKLSQNKLEAKEMFFTENGKGRVKTVFIKAVKDAQFGVKVHPNLVTNDAAGNYLEVLHTKNFLKK